MNDGPFVYPRSPDSYFRRHDMLEQASLNYVSWVCAFVAAIVVVHRPDHRTYADKGCQVHDQPPPSHMWHIAEILHIIISTLSSQDQFRVALVSKRIWEVTMPILWRTIPHDDNNRPIMNLLPGAMVQFLQRRDACLIEIPHPRSTPWDRFFYHAKLVRSFQFTLGDTDGHRSVALLEALESEGVARIFPRLEKLHIYIWGSPKNAEVVRCLFGPLLRDLRLEFVGDEDGGVVDLSDSLIRMLATTHQLELRRLSISAPESRLAFNDTALIPVTRAIEAQPRLEDLGIHDFPWRFREPLLAASLLPNLHTIKFTEDDCEFDPFTSTSAISNILPSPGFTCLRHVKAELLPSAAPTLLSSVLSPSLESLEVFFQAWPNNLSTMTGALVDIQRFSHLKSVRIVFARSIATWDDFAGLMECASLEEVALSGHHASTLVTNREIELMAGAWPLLEELEIEDLTRLPDHNQDDLFHLNEGINELAYPPAVTLAGLAALAHGCHRLRRLKLSVDARTIPSCEAIVPSMVTDISFPSSFAGDQEDEIAAVIVCMWPHQKVKRPEGGCWHSWWYDPYYISNGVQTEVMGQRWKRIWGSVQSILQSAT